MVVLTKLKCKCELEILRKEWCTVDGTEQNHKMSIQFGK